MILTVTLNPALDLFEEVERLEPGMVIRSASTSHVAGGKGINTGRLLQDLNHRVVAAFPANREGDDFTRLVEEEGLQTVSIPTGRPVRTNVHVFERATGNHFKINAPGESLDQSALDLIRDSLEPWTLKASALVLAGSLPPGLPTSAWARLARMGKRHGVTVAIDAEGGPLRKALDVPPDIVKVNRRELSDTLGCPIESMDMAVRASRELLGRGTSLVAITCHESETCLVTREGVWIAAPPRIAPRRAVGAGDAFLAGLLHARLTRLGPADMLRWGIACGTAVALSEGHTRIRAREAEELLGEVAVKEA